MVQATDGGPGPRSLPHQSASITITMCYPLSRGRESLWADIPGHSLQTVTVLNSSSLFFLPRHELNSPIGSLLLLVVWLMIYDLWNWQREDGTDNPFPRTTSGGVRCILYP